MLYRRLSITLFVVLSILLGNSSVYAAEVFLGGDSIGIELNYDGVVISGTYDISIDNKSYNPSSDGFVSGDLIKKVNDKTVKSISNLMKLIESDIEKQKPIFLTIQRDGRIYTRTENPTQSKTILNRFICSRWIIWNRNNDLL